MDGAGGGIICVVFLTSTFAAIFDAEVSHYGGDYGGDRRSQGPSSLAIALAVPLLSPLVAPFKYLTSLPWLGAPVATVDMSANRIEESASSCVARCPKINNYINWLAIS